MTTVGKDVGKVEHLRDALEPVRPEHEGLRLVTHSGEDAYTMVAVPDYLAGSFLCDEASAKNPYAPPEATTERSSTEITMPRCSRCARPAIIPRL